MRLFNSIVLLMMFTTLALDEEPGHVCPSDQAAKQGFEAFGAFHEVMAPTWHSAYPAKDLDALVAAGPKFDSLFKGIADIQPTMKSVARKAAFLNHREKFAQLVKDFAGAAKAGLKDSCYVLMPSVHEEFENTAHMLSPFSYPELEGAIMTAGIIVEQHIPNKNMDGIIGSTETLVTKVTALNESTIPAEVKGQQEAMVKELARVYKLAALMKDCCDKKDMENYKIHATELSAKLKEVSETYL